MDYFKDKEKEDELEEEDLSNIDIDLPEQDKMSSLNDDIALQNRALEELISNQRNEEQQIRDNYDSFNSRLGRALEVFGAGLKGENTSAVLQNQRDRLDKQLQASQSRYRDQRDSAYTKLKDTLARYDNLDKLKYDRERDQIKDSQFEKEFGLKTKAQADQNAIAREQLNLSKAQSIAKQNEALQNLNDLQALKEQEKSAIENDINNLLSNLNPKDILPTRDSEEISSARINDLNLKIAKNKYDKEGKDAVSFINENPSLFLNDKDSKDVLRGKLNIWGYNVPEDTSVVDAQKKVDAEYIKKLDRISKDPNKTNKLLSKYNNDPKAAYRAWMNKPRIFDTLD